MTFPRLFPSLAAAAVVSLSAGLLAGCTSEPDPAPTPTPLFATEEEAYAAAEEVYRAYIEADNDERSGGSPDPGPLEYLTGLALEAQYEADQYFRGNNIRLDGRIEIDSLRGASALIAANPATIEIVACFDYGSTRLLDSSGTDLTPADRPVSSALLVSLVAVEGHLYISDSNPTEVETC